jgi:hypothetical protein
MLPAASASAGRLIATGHDADHHCGRVTTEPKDGDPHRQCHFVEVAVNYVRGGAPDPTKPVLVLDRGALDVVASLDRIYGPGVMPRTVIDPRSSQFASEPLTTDRYSAIIVASSGGDPEDPTQQDLNAVGSAPDSEAIAARAADIRAFFDAGGGVYANSGSVHGDGPGDPYYEFLPITVASAAVTSPFSLTDAGRALGFVEDDVACCPTHNTFETPSAESALKAIDIDADGRVVSVFAETQRFESLGDAPVTPETVQEVSKDLPSTAGCVRRTSITLRLRRPTNRRFSRATIYLNKKRVKRLRGRRITRPIKIDLTSKRLASAAKARFRIVIITTGKRKIVVRRTYRLCT